MMVQLLEKYMRSIKIEVVETVSTKRQKQCGGKLKFDILNFSISTSENQSETFDCLRVCLEVR